MTRPDASFFLASHTGSGKTLAYLLPLIQRLKNEEEELAASTNSVTTLPNRPKAIILGPTRELTDQIGEVVRTLAIHAKVRSSVINAGA